MTSSLKSFSAAATDSAAFSLGWTTDCSSSLVALESSTPMTSSVPIEARGLCGKRFLYSSRACSASFSLPCALRMSMRRPAISAWEAASRVRPRSSESSQRAAVSQ